MAKYRALGTQLQTSDMATPTPAFASIGQLTTIEGPGGDTEDLDVTTHDSSASYREFVSSFHNPGEVSIAGMYDPALATQGSGAHGLAGLYASGAQNNFKLVLPTSPSATLSFAGYVKSFKVNSDFDKALTFNSTIKVTGPVTFPA